MAAVARPVDLSGDGSERGACLGQHTPRASSKLPPLMRVLADRHLGRRANPPRRGASRADRFRLTINQTPSARASLRRLRRRPSSRPGVGGAERAAMLYALAGPRAKGAARPSRDRSGPPRARPLRTSRERPSAWVPGRPCKSFFTGDAANIRSPRSSPTGRCGGDTAPTPPSPGPSLLLRLPRPRGHPSPALYPCPVLACRPMGEPAALKAAPVEYWPE